MIVLKFLLLISEFLALACSVLFFFQYKNNFRAGEFVPIFLGFIFLSEFTNMLNYFGVLPFSVISFVNFQIPGQAIFYILLYTVNFESKKSRTLGVVFCLFFLVILLIENINALGLNSRFNMISSMFGSFFIIILSLLYLLQSAKESAEKEFVGNVLNWISLGVFLAYTIDIAVFSLSNFYGDLCSAEQRILHPIYSVRLIFMILLYCSFSIGFVISKWKKKSL